MAAQRLDTHTMTSDYQELARDVVNTCINVRAIDAWQHLVADFTALY